MHTIRVVDGKIEVGHYCPVASDIGREFHDWWPLARCRSMEQACSLLSWINGGAAVSINTIANIDFVERPNRTSS